MKYLDLFAGIGGFALGAYRAGWRFDEHYFSEVDKYAIEVYRRRFPDAIPLGDIKEVDTTSLADTSGARKWKKLSGVQLQKPSVPIEDRVRLCDGANSSSEEWFVTGGFPCQDISVAGKGEGIGGRRSGLWFEM
ncbi:unnamed protein product, partial [marine sediment metagenome]